MTRTQLVALFPDGKTAHIPADGKPLPGYKQALAELQRARGASAPAFVTHTHALRLYSEAASLFADREEWDAAYEYERRHRDRYVALQKVAARAERLSLQARYELYRTQVERDFERRKREAAESAHATVQALNQSLSQRLDEIQVLQAALQEQVITDPLTGLYNRRFLAEVLPREFERASREGHPVAVALIDLDAFKRVNDLHGHAVGDEVLRRLATLLRENTRGTDYCCRFGGEEFPGWTRTRRRSASIATMAFMCRPMSMTRPVPTTWPASEVPAVRGIRPTRCAWAKRTSSPTSSSVRGKATASGIS